MKRYRTRSQKLAVIACGLAMSAAVLVPSAASARGADACLEPFIDRCTSSTANCTSCSTYCADHTPAGQCQVEFDNCDYDVQICPGGGTHINDACSCEKKRDEFPCGPEGC